MKTFYFYDLTTGLFTGRMVSSNSVNPLPFVEKNTPAGMGYKEFSGSMKDNKVDLATGLIVPVEDTALSAQGIRQKIAQLRDQMMRTGDSSLLDQIKNLQDQLNI